MPAFTRDRRARPVGSVQVDQRVFEVVQLELHDRALDQLGVTGRHGSRQAACRPWAPAAEHGTPRRLGYLQTIERVTDRWADLAEPLGQRTVAFCRDVHHERVGLSHGLPERGRRIDQAEQAGRVALGDQHRGDRQASPGGRPTRRPDGDGRYQAPAQPPSRVATLGGVVNGCSVPMRIGWSPVVMSALWAPPAHILQPKAGTAAPLGRPGLDPEAVAVCHHRASGHRRDRLAGKAEHGRLGGFGVDDQRPRSQRCWHDGRGRPPALRCCSAARTFTRSWT
jgi:hypothetical protein